MKLVNKTIDESIKQQLINTGRHPIVSQILAARNISSSKDVDYPIEQLLSPNKLLNCNEAADFLCDAIQKQKKLPLSVIMMQMVPQVHQ